MHIYKKADDLNFLQQTIEFSKNYKIKCRSGCDGWRDFGAGSVSDKMEQITGQGCRALKIGDVATRFRANFCPARFPPFFDVDSELNLEIFLFVQRFHSFPLINLLLLLTMLPSSKSDTFMFSYKTFYMKPYPVGGEMYASGDQEFSKF